MSRADPTTNISNWNTHVAGMQQSSAEFYREVERLIGVHHLKDVKQERVDIKEGGIFSSKREYLQVRRDEYVFHVCAAPYGNGFFISWWFGSVEKGWIAFLLKLPLFGTFIRRFVKPWTYYRVDTANMFNAITSGAVYEALDALIKANGLRTLSAEELRPHVGRLMPS